MIVWVSAPFFLLDKIAVCVTVHCRKIRNIDMRTAVLLKNYKLSNNLEFILSDRCVGICICFFTKIGLILLIIVFCNLPFHQKCIL